MPRLSEKKRTKISEQILYYLFSCAPESRFVSQISEELVRDEEFIKDLIKNLHKKNLVVLISKNSSGKIYQKRQRWRLSNQAFEIYSQKQVSLAHKNINLSANSEDF